MELTRLLMDYALFKHREIFAPALAAGGDKSRDGQKLKIACIAAGQEYRDFIRAGSHADPVAEWNAYRASAMAMARTMTAHLAKERAGLRKLLGVRASNAVSDAPPTVRDETVHVQYI